jgi:uncharacterized membrane protein
MRWGRAIRSLPFVFYPFVVYVALAYVEAKYVGVALLVLLGLRYRSDPMRMASAFNGIGWIVALLTVSIAALVWWSNDESWLRLYPAFFNLIALAIFGYTLWRPPSMIERFARLQSGELSADGVRYTRRVTIAWCGFFVVNGATAAYTALYASRELWTVYNGFIAYCLMGVMFVGEWLVRRYVLSEEPAR